MEIPSTRSGPAVPRRSQVEAIQLWSQKIREKVMPGFSLSDEDGCQCKYRFPDGDPRECAIGVLIPRSVMPENCRWGIARLVHEKGEAFGQLIEGVSVDGLGKVQCIHDSCRWSPVNEFRHRFFTRLRDSGLFADVPDQVWTEVLQD